MIAAAVQTVQGDADNTPPTSKGRGKGKGRKQGASDVGRESTFPLANLQAYQGISTLKAGETFTYNRAKGRGSSDWKVTKVAGGIVHAVKVG